MSLADRPRRNQESQLKYRRRVAGAAGFDPDGPSLFRLAAIRSPRTPRARAMRPPRSERSAPRWFIPTTIATRAARQPTRLTSNSWCRSRRAWKCGCGTGIENFAAGWSLRPALFNRLLTSSPTPKCPKSAADVVAYLRSRRRWRRPFGMCRLCEDWRRRG